ncbi:acetyl-CoA acetyltransferase [Mycobacterium sp. CBMA 234]|uniref:acetyl-CoA acetyltransferase n=1 Tax=Mycolicibacterium sp. CBMA 234 TaxID=1918495 RepID=UPI0012DCCB48|nr:acetyl-CoA acetyltransferase [Mycolicibacterium sp. CBMA 234]MUL67885.1 acetyl-CoA acetyltransferase [Mycolicibacterium sp. CBMA 234]
MPSNGIAGKVAVVGMGCSQFGERWDTATDDLILEAYRECLASTHGVTQGQIDAFWLGTLSSGLGGLTLSRAIGTDDKPVTRVENFCATGSEAFRNACYAVAAGAYDVAMAVGVEKLKDSGYSGLLRQDPPGDGTAPEISMTAPAAFSLLDPAYCAKYSVHPDEMRAAMTHVAWKNHDNGTRNPKAQFRSSVSRETIDAAPKVAGRLGVFDCSGVSDGAACALIVPADRAHEYTASPMYVDALALVAGSTRGAMDPAFDYTTFPEVVAAAKEAYAQAGIRRPAAELSLAEVHDCFTPTEIVLMEDLGFSDAGTAWKDVLGGAFDADGRLPVNPDGGLKSFGHPVGASGLRMLYEAWLQFRGAAGARQLHDPHTALTHNLGGRPGGCVSFVSIVSRELRQRD